MLLVLLIDILCLALSHVCVCYVADAINDSSIRFSIHSLAGSSVRSLAPRLSVNVAAAARPEIIHDAE